MCSGERIPARHFWVATLFRREPMRLFRIVPCTVLILLACALLAGCGAIAAGTAALAHNPEKKIKARYDPAGKSVAVIPFVHKGLPPFKTEGGLLLADTLEGLLRLNVKDIRMVPVGPAKTYFSETPFGDADYRHVADMLGADVVIYGEIKDIDLADSLNRIIAQVHVEAYEALTGAIVLKQNLPTRYPEGHTLSPSEIDTQGIYTRGILVASAQSISRLFYDHKVRNRVGSERPQ